MHSLNENPDLEINAIAAISSALVQLPDAETRRRVLAYVLARFLPDQLSVSGAPVIQKVLPANSQSAGLLVAPKGADREMPGIARVTDSGDLKITARDLKAKSGLDAAVRLAHIAIYVSEKLIGQPLSSRKGLTPILKEWRVYDGNARHRLAKERGIIRAEDSLSLDAHARNDAERYINEILDPQVEGGAWKPR